MKKVAVIKKLEQLNTQYEQDIDPFLVFKTIIEDEVNEGTLSTLQIFIDEGGSEYSFKLYLLGIRWTFCFEMLTSNVNNVTPIKHGKHVGKVGVWCGYAGNKDIEVGSFLFNSKGLTTLPDPDKPGEWLSMVLPEHAVFIVTSFITNNYRTILKGDISFEFILLD